MTLSLPGEILEMILLELSIKDIYCYKLVSTIFNNLTNTEHFWKVYCDKHSLKKTWFQSTWKECAEAQLARTPTILYRYVLSRIPAGKKSRNLCKVSTDKITTRLEDHWSCQITSGIKNVQVTVDKKIRILSVTVILTKPITKLLEQMFHKIISEDVGILIRWIGRSVFDIYDVCPLLKNDSNKIPFNENTLNNVLLSC